MKTCPKCNETNGDKNTVCFACGANLPETKPTGTQTTKLPDNTNVSNVDLKKNSEKISSMAATVCIIGIILGVVLGFIFKTATIGDSYLDYELKYSFNWVLCISTVLGTICFTVLLTAMSYIAKAIEEK